MYIGFCLFLGTGGNQSAETFDLFTYTVRFWSHSPSVIIHHWRLWRGIIVEMWKIQSKYLRNKSSDLYEISNSSYGKPSKKRKYETVDLSERGGGSGAAKLFIEFNKGTQIILKRESFWINRFKAKFKGLKTKKWNWFGEVSFWFRSYCFNFIMCLNILLIWWCKCLCLRNI